MKKKIIVAAILSVTVVVAALLFIFNPEHEILALKCPVWMVTGFKCPGCGSQRMFHHIFHGELRAAFIENPLLTVSLPYFALVFWYGLFGSEEKYPRLRNVLLGRKTLIIFVVTYLIYAVVRNIFGF